LRIGRYLDKINKLQDTIKHPGRQSLFLVFAFFYFLSLKYNNLLFFNHQQPGKGEETITRERRSRERIQKRKEKKVKKKKKIKEFPKPSPGYSQNQ